MHQTFVQPMCTQWLVPEEKMCLSIQSKLAILDGLKAEVTMQRCWDFDCLKHKEAKIQLFAQMMDSMT